MLKLTKAGKKGGPGLLMVCCGGIFFVYLLYGIIQEGLYKPQPTGQIDPVTGQPVTERFRFTLLLLFTQCAAGAVLAAVAQVMSALAFSAKPDRSAWTVVKSSFLDGRAASLVRRYEFAVCAVLFAGAMGFSNEALRYVSYPFQALAKSAKPIPVMLSRVIVLGATYGRSKYLCILAIVGGVALFQYYRVSGKADGRETQLWGVLLLMGSLTMDGVTGPVQEWVHSKYSTSNLSFMFLNNLFGALIMGAALVCSSQLSEGVAFLTRHPLIFRQLLVFALSSAVGQLFIFTTLLMFDSLVCTTVTTLRKFTTIVVSVLYHGNHLEPMQWLSVFIVFMAIVIDSKLIQRLHAMRTDKSSDSSSSSSSSNTAKAGIQPATIIQGDGGGGDETSGEGGDDVVVTSKIVSPATNGGGTLGKRVSFP